MFVLLVYIYYHPGTWKNHLLDESFALIREIIVKETLEVFLVNVGDMDMESPKLMDAGCVGT